MTITVFGEINNESAREFIEKINSVNNEAVQIIITSTGGDWFAAIAMLQAVTFKINTGELKAENIFVVACGAVESAALTLWAECPGKKGVIPGTIGMWHQTAVHLRMQKSGSVNEGDGMWVSWFKGRGHEGDIEWANKIGLSSKEIKRFNKGEDVYLDYDRLLTLAKNFNSIVKSM